MEEEKVARKVAGALHPVYVFVVVFQLIVEDVRLFDTVEEAEEAFKEYTGHDYEEWTEADTCPDEDYDQCKIFVLNYPFLED